MSRDHDWDVRLHLLVDDRHVPTIAAAFAEDPGITVTSPPVFLIKHLGANPLGEWGIREWLAITGQSVLEVTAGAVFIDTDGRLSQARQALTWYPRDLWVHLLACDWRRLSQELPLMSRAGYRGDDLGSRVIATRLVGVAMHLAFLLRRSWPPYPKWYGTFFAQLPGVHGLQDQLESAVAAHDWRERQERLGAALTILAGWHDEAGAPLPGPVVVPFWDRPFLVVDEALPSRLVATIEDPWVRALPLGGRFG